MKEVKFHKKDLPSSMLFCIDCKFYVEEIPWEKAEACKIIRIVKWDYEKSWYEWNVKPKKQNAQNDCAGYKKKWWK